MPKIELNTPSQTIELWSTWHYAHGPDAKTVCFTVRRGNSYVTTITLTPDDARMLGKLLVEEANHIDKAVSLTSAGTGSKQTRNAV